MQYLFSLDGQPIADWTENPTWTWTTSEADIGQHTIEVKVRDNKHNPEGDDARTADFVIAAPPNNPPALSALASDQDSPQVAGAAVTWTATASDPENDPVQYLFSLDGQPIADWTENPTWTWTTSEADIGQHTIEVKVRDNKHNPEGDDARTADFVIAAPPNNPPALSALACGSGQPAGCRSRRNLDRDSIRSRERSPAVQVLPRWNSCHRLDWGELLDLEP